MPKTKKVTVEKRALVAGDAPSTSIVPTAGSRSVTPEMGPEGLIALAIERGVNVDSLERLLGMRRELKAESAREIFHESLARFQASCPSIEKTKQVYDKHDKPRYRYAPLEHIIDTVKYSLMQNGFSYSFDTVYETDPPAQRVTCTLTHISGHRETSTFRSPIDPDAYMNETQKVASALTYGKRYTFIGVTGIVTADEDDDARTCATEERQTQSYAPKPTEVKRAVYGEKELALLAEIEEIMNHPRFPKDVATTARKEMAKRVYKIETLLKYRDSALIVLDRKQAEDAKKELENGTVSEADGKKLSDEELEVIQK